MRLWRWMREHPLAAVGLAMCLAFAVVMGWPRNDKPAETPIDTRSIEKETDCDALATAYAMDMARSESADVGSRVWRVSLDYASARLDRMVELGCDT